MAAQKCDGFIRIQTERPSAIGHDFTVQGQLVQPLSKLLNGDRPGLGQVARLILVGGPHIQHDHLAGPRPLNEGLAVGGAQVDRIAHELMRSGPQLQQMLQRGLSQMDQQGGDVGSGESIDLKTAIALGFDHARGLERPQMGAGQPDVNLQSGREGLDRLVPLGKQLQQLQPLGAAKGLAHLGNLAVELVFEFPGRHLHSLIKI